MPILTRPRFGAFVCAHPWQSYEIFQPFRWDLYLLVCLSAPLFP